MTKAEFLKAYRPKPEPKPAADYGVFQWRGDARYHASEAIRTFKSLKRAEDYARDHELVVREMRYLLP